MGLMRVDNMLLRPEKQHQKYMKSLRIFSAAWRNIIYITNSKDTVFHYHVLLYKKQLISDIFEFVKWAQLQPRFWMLLLHSFIFTPNHKSNEMDSGKHIYGDSANVMCEAGRAIRVPTKWTEWKQTERRLGGSRGNWKVSVIRTEVFRQEASRGLNWKRSFVLLTQSHSSWIAFH